MLDLRDEVRSLMQFRIGNGNDVSVWHDRWCNLPAIDTIVSKREIYAAGLSNEDTVADCIFENEWRWPENWYIKYPILQQYTVPNLNVEIKDKLMWISNNGTEKEYACNHVWKDISILNDSVQWWKVIWFTQNIPRHAFVVWMAIKGKLVTRDKLAKWYPGQDWKCPFCVQTEDSHKHLFFECHYSKIVWGKMQEMANIQNMNDLENCINCLAALPCKNSIWSVVRRLCIADTVYHLWQERNTRLVQKKERSSNSLIKNIMDSVKSRLLTLKVKNSSAVKNVEDKWEIQMVKK